jgi:phosphate:Na+ symporter
MLISVAENGVITFSTGISILYGAHIGTCSTAIIAALGKHRLALQVAFVHLSFNVIGVAIFLGLVPQMEAFVSLFPPHSDSPDEVTRRGIEVPRQIANGQTFFKVFTVLLILPLVRQYAQLIQKIIPYTPPTEKDAPLKPLYLDEVYLDISHMAFDRLHLEERRLIRFVGSLIHGIPQWILHGKPDDMQRLHTSVEEARAFNSAMVHYMSRLSARNKMMTRHAYQFVDLVTVHNLLENSIEVIALSLIPLGRERLENHDTLSELGPVHNVYFEFVSHVWGLLEQSFASDDQKSAAQEVSNQHAKGRKMYSMSLTDLSEQLLLSKAASPLFEYRVKNELVMSMKRLFFNAILISRRLRKVGYDSHVGDSQLEEKVENGNTGIALKIQVQPSGV